MWNHVVIPNLQEGLGPIRIEERLEVSVMFVPESLLEEACASAVAEVASQMGVALSEMPVWGTRVQLYRISLYLQGGTKETREAVLVRLQEDIGEERLRAGDVQAVDLLSELLKEKGLTIAGAESCTGGLAGTLLTDAPGSSSYFWGSMVTYANEAKERVLAVAPETLMNFGAVSSQTVKAMAEGVLSLSGVAASFSISGIAGPTGGTEEKPVGTVWFGFSSSFRESEQVSLYFRPYTRDSVRRRAAICAILLLEQYVKGNKLLDIVNQWQYI